MIKSPYNFVPLSKHIFFPDWADQISHDVPFSDGESGEITVKLTAETPIFVRNGHKKNEAEDKVDNWKSFSKNNKGDYFIPGTSIKGMIRNVLEIMSFGKMQFVDDRRLSWRDLSNPDYTKNFTKDIKATPLVKAGFIEVINGEWKLIPCNYARIEQCELDEQLGTQKLSAVDKYNYWTKDKTLNKNFKYSNRGTNVFEKQCGSHIRATLDNNGKEGQLVFTGQIGPRKNKGEGLHGIGKKHLEFVFFDEETKQLNISDDMRKDFELNHSDERNKAKHINALSPNKEWSYWKEKLENNKKMPVFWLEQSNSEVSSFGLSMLYRLPLKQSIHEQIDLTREKHVAHINKGKFDESKFEADLADSIFGYTVNKKTLKGRVQFSHAYSKNDTVVLNEESVLASPKPTFYPNYLENGNYSSKNKVSGWKRYPVHKTIDKNLWNNNENDNIKTQFSPLDKGAEFECKIKFHNLKKLEIGALLSALTFHKTENCCHSIGMGKPLGFGKIKIDVQTNKLELNIEDYLKEFERVLNIYIYEKSVRKVKKNKWAENLLELITMASEHINSGDSTLAYMELEGFVNVKKAKQRLKKYSLLENINKKQINSYLLDNEIIEIFEEYDNEIVQQQNTEEATKQRAIDEAIEQENVKKKQIEIDQKNNYKGDPIGILLNDNIYKEFNKIMNFVGIYPKIESDKEKEILIQALENSFNSTKEKSNDWKKAKSVKKNKVKIIKWVGDDYAKKLFIKIGI